MISSVHIARRYTEIRNPIRSLAHSGTAGSTPLTENSDLREQRPRPAFWHDPRRQHLRHLVIPGLAKVLKALPSDLFPLDVVAWFLLPDPELRSDNDASPLSPREWLPLGRAFETVARLARDLTRA